MSSEPKSEKKWKPPAVSLDSLQERTADLNKLAKHETSLPARVKRILTKVFCPRKIVDEELSLKHAERLGSLRIWLPILDKILGNMNHTHLEWDETLKDSFKLDLDENTTQSFPRKIFLKPVDEKTGKAEHLSYPEELPVFSLRVKIGPNFNVARDLPSLINAVEKAHNEQIKNYDSETKQDSNPMMFIDTNRELAAYWAFVAEKLKQFLKNNMSDLMDLVEDQALRDSAIGQIEAFIALANELSEGFGGAQVSSNDYPLPAVDRTAVLEHGWQRTEKDLSKLLQALRKRIERTEGGDFYTVQIGTNEIGEKEKLEISLQEMLQKLIAHVSIKGQNSIIEELNIQTETVFIEHAQAELYRKLGLDGLVKRYSQAKEDHPEADLDDPSVVVKEFYERNRRDSKWIVAYIKDNFPKEQAELDQLKTEIRRLKENPNEVTNLSRAQINLAYKLCALIHSQRLFAYNGNSYSFADATEKNHVNCMLRGELLFQLWREYAGEEGFGAVSFSHYFFIVKLANGLYLSLDGRPSIFNPNNKSVYGFGDHGRFYIASLAVWFGLDESLDPKTRELMHKLALRIGVMYNINYASFLEQQGRYEEAELYSLKALRIDPNNLNIIYNYACLLKDQNDPKRYPEAQIKFDHVYQILENHHFKDEYSFWMLSTIANFYHKKADYLPEGTNWMKKALDIYKKALEVYKKNSNVPYWISAQEIKVRIKKISGRFQYN